MRTNLPDKPENCMVEVAMEILGGRWKLAIVYKLLLQGTHRFGELKREMTGITPRMLTRQLRELEEDGIVSRTVHREVPPRVDYALTETGRSLEEIVRLLDGWGRWYLDHRPGTSPSNPEQARQTADGPAGMR
ncbi:winged helix-turn-helix transcriptional regulator [Nonomuraea diastatica]|uniref:Transcriptional regulator n=1 Tax=Nonomuraea diastatica TaxID=1848329 RepID=A0A4R4WXW7_9ACTN|nr:helix-turn-helix domain-containing protein [Nonomuraea diastatica]TDD22679.1 transcriptional regulator [Nonomuraea diastatica]